jgi:hypothetical protein
MGTLVAIEPTVRRCREVVCPCPINCEANRALSRMVFTWAVPQACQVKRCGITVRRHWTANLILPAASLACFAGATSGLTLVGRWIPALFAVAVAAWVLVLQRAQFLPFLRSVVLFAIQSATALAFFRPNTVAPSSKIFALICGLAIANVLSWVLLLVRSICTRPGRTRMVLFAAIAGLLVSASILRVQPLIPELSGILIGSALLHYGARRSPSMPHGLYHLAYAMTI